MKQIILVAVLLTAVCISISADQASAAGEAQTTVVPVYDENGNTLRHRSVPMSTSSIVLISSAPENAVINSSDSISLGISSWRFREIINISTCAALALYPDSSYKTYSSTYGIVLSSDSSGLGRGDSFVIPGQTPIWGIWTPAGNATPGACPGGGGALVYETYYLQSGKR